jgi:Flp pilus assembly protein TadD
VKKKSLGQAYQARAQKTGSLLSLSSAFRHAVESGNLSRAARILAQVEKIRKPDDPYLLKLKAFQEIEKKNYSRARALLTRVLTMDRTDFEAGFNMAVVEIRLHQYDRARARLEALKNRYPFQDAIDDLLNRL